MTANWTSLRRKKQSNQNILQSPRSTSISTTQQMSIFPAYCRIHSWGDSLEEAYEQCAMGMFGYMTDTETVQPIDTVEVESEGEDLESLLFHFLDDWLFKFSADMFFIPREVKVLHIDRMHYKIRSIGWGEEFSLDKHPQGTEVKAITYSAMQVHDKEKSEIFVIIDI
ncbi:protein archease isoform X1 [Triplophysa dalaica]|uniref:protein archease isoform X1 n=1 Tax=Triplophysa dalaica TaxID=1582913 RepID=UPI0024DF9BC3|nr:protein archease isoform X1 [Triplophysa dalaica]